MAAEQEATDTTAPEARQQGADFVRKFADAWGASSVDRLVELLADDVVLSQPLLSTTRGKAAARDAFERLFIAFPALTATVHRWAAREDLVFIEFTLSTPFGGRTLSWPAVDRFRLRDGLVAERVNYINPLRLFAGIALRPRGWRGLARSRLLFGGRR